MATNAEIDMRVEAVLDGMALGMSIQAIADDMSVSRDTIERDIKRIASNRRLRDRAMAIVHQAMGRIATDTEGDPYKQVAAMAAILRLPAIIEADADADDADTSPKWEFDSRLSLCQACGGYFIDWDSILHKDGHTGILASSNEDGRIVARCKNCHEEMRKRKHDAETDDDSVVVVALVSPDSDEGMRLRKLRLQREAAERKRASADSAAE